jgi:hypothetical protein
VTERREAAGSLAEQGVGDSSGLGDEGRAILREARGMHARSQFAVRRLKKTAGSPVTGERRQVMLDTLREEREAAIGALARIEAMGDRRVAWERYERWYAELRSELVALLGRP